MAYAFDTDQLPMEGESEAFGFAARALLAEGQTVQAIALDVLDVKRIAIAAGDPIR